MSELLSILKGKTVKATAILAFFTILAKIAGLLRDRVLASNFGASSQLDVYFSAFKIPDLIFNLVILGAVSSAFIPVFIKQFRQDREQAWQLAQNAVNVGFVFVFIASVIIFIFAPQLAWMVAPGFSGYEYALLVKLLRLMLLSTLIFSVSTIVGSILQALERFTAYAIAPILYNLGIIIGAIYIAPAVLARGHDPAIGLGLGVILGALFHLLIQLPSVWRSGFRFGKIFNLGDAGLRRIIKLMIPRTIGIGAAGIESFLINAFASFLGAGSIAVMNFASNIHFVPISVLGVSVATASFPQLSEHAASGEHEQFQRQLSKALRQTALVVGMVALLMFLFRHLIIRIIFQAGAFNVANSELTASVFGIFLFGVVAQSLIPIISRAFYALQDTMTPVIIAISTIVLNITLSAIFVFVLGWGLRGLALAYAIVSNVSFIVRYIMFRKKHF